MPTHYREIIILFHSLKLKITKQNGSYYNQSITPHYASLSLLKFLDIVKLNTCTYNYLYHKKFAKFASDDFVRYVGC